MIIRIVHNIKNLLHKVESYMENFTRKGANLPRIMHENKNLQSLILRIGYKNQNRL